jgi:hypothetical protein
LRHWYSCRCQVGLVDFCFGGGKFHLQVDPERLFQLLLVVDRCERSRIERGELAFVMDEARFGDGNGNVVGQPLLDRRDDHRPGRFVLTRGNAHALCFQLVA